MVMAVIAVIRFAGVSVAGAWLICRTSLSGSFHWWSSGRAAVAAGWSGREGGRRVADPVEQGGPGGLPGPGLGQVQGDPAG